MNQKEILCESCEVNFSKDEECLDDCYCQECLECHDQPCHCDGCVESRQDQAEAWNDLD